MEEEQMQGIGQSTALPSNSDLMQWVLDTKELIISLRNYFEGVMPEVRGGKIMLSKVSEPLMNKTGINTTLMVLHPVNKQALMSELSDQDIRDIVGDINEDYVEAVAINTNKFNNRWGVRPGDRSITVTAVVNYTRTALLMARNAGFRKDVRTMETINVQKIDEPNKRWSIFGK